MTNLEARRLPETFASLRLVGPDLDPLSVSSYIGLKPTVSYARGDPFMVGERKIVQERRFGLWLFSTEGLIESPRIRDHERALLLGLTTPRLRGREELRLFMRELGLDLTVSLYWYGPEGLQLPTVSDRLADFVESVGGTIETDFEIAEADERAA